jgi:hypothetical protein
MKLLRSYTSNWQDISSRFIISLLYSVSKERFRSVTEQRGNLGGHVTTKTTGHWFPTEDVQVQSQVSACGICDGQSGTRTSFTTSNVLFLSIIPLILHIDSPIIQSWYNRPSNDNSSKVLRLTLPQQKKKKYKLLIINAQDRQCMYNVTMRHVCATMVAVGKQ